MPDLATLRSRVGMLFAEQMQVEVPPVDADLFETGLLDSLAFVNLLVVLEQELGVRVSIDDLEIDNFRSIAKIAQFAADKMAVDAMSVEERGGNGHR